MSLSCQQLALMLTAKRRTRLNKLNNNTNNTGFNHSVNVKFVGRRYTTRPGAPAEVSVLASTPPGMPGTHPPQYFGWGDVNGNTPPPILLRTFGYSRPILVAFRLLSLKPISFGYKTPPIRFSQAVGQSAHKARPPNLELALTPLSQW